jgi:hypothetical protein
MQLSGWAGSGSESLSIPVAPGSSCPADRFGSSPPHALGGKLALKENPMVIALSLKIFDLFLLL